MGRRWRDCDSTGIGVGGSISPRRIDVEPELVHLGPARSRPGCCSRRRVGTGACSVQIGLAGLKAHQIAGRLLGLATACTCRHSWSWIWPCGMTCSSGISWVHMKPSIVLCGGHTSTSMRQHSGSASTVLSLALGATHQTGLISLRRPRGIVGPVVAVVAALLSLLLLMPIPRTAAGSAASASSGLVALILRVGTGGIVGMQVV